MLKINGMFGRMIEIHLANMSTEENTTSSDKISISSTEIKLVERMYDLHQKGIVIGLTGRTGSGCSTTAEVLCAGNLEKSREIASEKVKELSEGDSTHKSTKKSNRIDQLKRNIVEAYLKTNIKKFEFKIIKIRHLILLHAFAIDDFNEFWKHLTATREKIGRVVSSEQIVEKKECSEEEISKIKELYAAIKAQFKDELDGIRKEDESALSNEKIENLIYKSLLEFDERLKALDAKKIRFSDVFQEWANNIRKCGSVYFKVKSKGDTGAGSKAGEAHKNLDTETLAEQEGTAQAEGDDMTKKKDAQLESRDTFPEALAKTADFIIKQLNKEKGKKRIFVIDSLRNPFEIHYLKASIPNFYLFSINMDSDLRYKKLKKNGLYDRAIKEIDDETSAKKEFSQSYTQIDISKCIEQSDVFIDFNLDHDTLFSSYFCQLETYLALLLHPGLIPPTEEERIMQVALAAKLNSGCLSRQVGAAVTTDQYSVLAIGWNTVPGGQIPCNLRNIYQLKQNHDKNIKFTDRYFKNNKIADFSKHELNDDTFRKATAKLCKEYEECVDAVCYTCQNGLGVSYCFKDVYNYSNEDAAKRKNQVHTRSLHAEENAFLQLAKHGSIGIQGGYLFTTASCCVLCAKKAYQLGIQKIFYVDSYPDISEDHILKSGDRRQWPHMQLFKGAIGKAYLSFYSSLIPIKDEIEYMTGVSVSGTFPVKQAVQGEQEGQNNVHSLANGEGSHENDNLKKKREALQIKFEAAAPSVE